jgi:hypothetical protein
LPFSFKEFLKATKFKPPKIITRDDEAKLRNLLRKYLKWGGFPEIIFEKERLRILREYYDLMLYRDFIERHKLKSYELARFLLSFLLQNFSKELSINKIAKALQLKRKFGKNTLYKYVEKIQDSVVVFFVNRFSPRVYERERWPKKVYVCDTGLTQLLRVSEDMGKLMENAVFLELVRKQNLRPLLEIFYLKINDQEVDFVLKEGARIKQLIQVTYASKLSDIAKRELKVLVKSSKLLRCKNLLLITWDVEDEVKIGNRRIKLIPLWKWLLGI